MHIFINEVSFEEQFQSRQEFEGAVVCFIGLVGVARTALLRIGGRMWRSNMLQAASALGGECLWKSLNHISQKDLREEFVKVVWDMANPAPWEPERLHEDCVHYLLPLVAPTKMGNVALVEGKTVTGTSVAELAERELRDPALAGGLIGLEHSRYFMAAEIHVLKVDHARVALRSWCKTDELEAWIRLRFPEPPGYSDDATDPPRDEQTCLVNRTVYAPTGRENAGRKIYRNKTSGYLYYVDNLHGGAAAHLEVFDKYGNHLGVASFRDGKLDKSKAEKGRTIDV